MPPNVRVGQILPDARGVLHAMSVMSLPVASLGQSPFIHPALTRLHAFHCVLLRHEFSFQKIPTDAITGARCFAKFCTKGGAVFDQSLNIQ